MPQTTMASAAFPNRRAAQRAAQRLIEGGFSRGSIEMYRLHSDDDAHEVSVRVRQGNAQRADDLLHARPGVHDFASHRVDVGPLLVLAGTLAVGVAAYGLFALKPRAGSRGEDGRYRP
jgi:hypothetical protein